MSVIDRAGTWIAPLAAAGSSAFVMPLIAHGYAGTASRYLGDDYCAGYIFRDYGFIGGQIWHYKSWSAVPTTLLLMAVTHPGGAHLAPILPAVAIVLWVASAAWALRRVSALSGSAWSWMLSLFVAEVIVYAVLQSAPDVGQSLYQRVPMLAYTCPLIVLTFLVGWLAGSLERDDSSPRALVVCASIALVFAAFGPVCAALLTAASVLGWAGTRLMPASPRRRTAARLFAAATLGSIAALVIVALGPGNAARQAYFPQPPGPARIVMWSLLYTVFMFCRPILPILRNAIAAVAPYVIGGNPRWMAAALQLATSPIPLAIVILGTGAVAISRGETPRTFPAKRLSYLLPVVAFVLVCACMAPGAYGTSAPPPPRALIIPQYVITVLAALWGYSMGIWWMTSRRQVRLVPAPVVWLAATSLVLVGPVAATPEILRNAAMMREWARRWDETEQHLLRARAAGVRDAVVPALDRLDNVGSISPNRQDWVNSCAAHYYGFDSITGTTAVP